MLVLLNVSRLQVHLGDGTYMLVLLNVSRLQVNHIKENRSCVVFHLSVFTIQTNIIDRATLNNKFDFEHIAIDSY